MFVDRSLTTLVLPHVLNTRSDGSQGDRDDGAMSVAVAAARPSPPENGEGASPSSSVHQQIRKVLAVSALVYVDLSAACCFSLLAYGRSHSITSLLHPFNGWTGWRLRGSRMCCPSSLFRNAVSLGCNSCHVSLFFAVLFSPSCFCHSVRSFVTCSLFCNVFDL